MGFQEELVRARKARGWSQEDLAVRIRVSRQAVSKWETGDAMPDLPKLVALADALETSLDVLCGRESPAERETPPERTGAPRSVQVGKHWRWPARWVLCVLLAVCLLAGGIWRWRNAVPADITVTGFGISSLSDGRLDFYFTPSAASERYTYQAIFTDQEGGSTVVEVPCVGGLCSGTVALDQSDTYSLTAAVSHGGSRRQIALASGLQCSDMGASWFPLA